MKHKLIFGLSLVLIICIIFGVNNKKQNPEASNQKYYACITIDEGETLWTIAEEHYSEEYNSYQEYIDEVKFINNLTDDTIYRGAKLVIPYYAAPL